MMDLLVYLRGLAGNDLLFSFIMSVLILLVSLILAKLFSYILKIVIKPFAAKTKTNLDDKILEVAETGIFRLIILAGFYFAFGNFKDQYFLFDQNASEKFSKSFPYINKILIAADYLLYIILVFIILLIIYRVITILFDWYEDKVSGGENRDLSGSLFPLLNKVSKIIIGALAIVIILSKFDVNISAFVVSLGVGSL